MASSSSASRSSPERSGCCDAPVAARPMRKSTFASTAPPRASGRRMPSASLNRLCSIRVRVSATAPAADWLAAGGGGGGSPALHAGAESKREAAARMRRRRLIVMSAALSRSRCKTIHCYHQIDARFQAATVRHGCDPFFSRSLRWRGVAAIARHEHDGFNAIAAD